MITTKQIWNHLIRLTNKRKFLLAYSGGLDSQVLLHLLSCLRQEFPIQFRAIHINHQLSSNANNWQHHCEQTCQTFKVSLLVETVKLRNENKNLTNIEEAAREARYEIFAKLLNQDEALLLAHQQDDQAETLLLQLLRGAGVKGLSAMPEKTAFAQAEMIRPLLSFTREQLKNYATEKKLSWIEDESNDNLRFDRNYIRKQLMPIIKQRWPSASNILNRVAKHCAETNELLEDIAAQDLAAVLHQPNNTLLINELKKLSDVKQRNVIRYWLQQLNFLLPSTINLKQLQQNVLAAKEDAMPLLTWQGVEIRRYQNQLFAMQPLNAHDPKIIIPWNLQELLILPNQLGILEPQTFAPLINHQQNITVRFRRGGERCKPIGRNGSHPLKKLMQEWQVLPWLRDRIPLIYCGENLIAVAGYCICAIDCH